MMLRILLLSLAFISTPAWSQHREAVDTSDEPQTAAAPLTPMNELFPKFRECAAGLLSLRKVPHKETTQDQKAWTDYIVSQGVYGGVIKGNIRIDYTADGIKTGPGAYFDGNVRRNPWTTVRPQMVTASISFDPKDPFATGLYYGKTHVSNDGEIRKALEDFDEMLTVDIKHGTRLRPTDAFDDKDLSILRKVGCKCSLYVKARQGTNGINELKEILEKFKASYIEKKMVQTGSRLRFFEPQDFECDNVTS